MEISSIGLAVIVIAWLAQLFYSWNGKKEIRREFLALYITGVLVLVLDGLLNSGKNPWIDLASMFIALLILARISKKK
ncbi:MAG: hypothetical protein V1886_02330 [archaeon]